MVVLHPPSLKNCLPPIVDERICHDEPGTRELGADLRILEATIDVPGVVDGARAVLVGLCWAHVKEERVILDRDKVNF